MEGGQERVHEDGQEEDQAEEQEAGAQGHHQGGEAGLLLQLLWDAKGVWILGF